MPALSLTATPVNATTGCLPTWNIVPSPNVEGMNNFLYDVKVIAADDIWATGSYRPYSPISAIHEEFEPAVGLNINETDQSFDWGGLLLHWDGSIWTIVDSTYNRDLNHLFGTASNNVWVSMINPYPSKQSFLHWNGTILENIPVPSVGSVLDGTSATDIWSMANPASIIHWDGISWTDSPSPITFPNTISLMDLKAFATEDVWAIGGENGNSAFYFPFFMRWDGATWTFPTKPVSSPYYLSNLDGVNGQDVWVSTTDYYQNGADYILHWDGNEWHHMLGPRSRKSNARYYGFKAVASADVWTVGSFAGNSAEEGRMLLGHWDGKRWSRILEPNLVLNRSSLSDIDGVNSEELWAVGAQEVNGQLQTLILRATRPCYLPPAPELRSPKNKAEVTETSIKLDWKYAPTATYYRLQVRPDNRKTKPIVRLRTENSEYRVENLLPNTKYLWRVRGCNGGGCGKWSPYQSFQVNTQ